MPQYRLTILDPLLARVFDVPLGVTLIGRESSANLPVVNTQVSRRHAHLISDGQICELIDLGSANGTFVNGERLIPQAPVTLEDGMRLRIGPVEMSVEVLPDPPQPELEQVGDESPGDILSNDSSGSVGGASRRAPTGTDESPPAELPAISPDLVLDLPSGSSPAGDMDEPLPAGPQDRPYPGTQGLVLPEDDGHDGGQPPSRPPTGTPWLSEGSQPENPFALPGLSIYSQHLINQLPGIYQTDFMARFLGIFESIHTPIEWTVDGFDLYLDPDSSPASFLSWLGSWYGLTFDASWSEEQRRLLIAEAHAIFARRGTRWALTRILEIYTGCSPDIIDTGDGIEPFTFRVRLALPDTGSNRTLITRLIDAHKPAYTTYRLELLP